MLVCYKCRTPWLEAGKPGFGDVCPNCGSYLHCCFNCRFYDEYTRPHCSEPNADGSFDPNGMNHCEYFSPRQARGAPLVDMDDPEQNRTRRRPDWRNLNKDGAQRPARNGAAGGGFTSPDTDERARKAREQLDKLFGKK
ncbi:MAG TPA: hypothetical protein ENN09_03970 [Planctomycetes bacterium]|nr:hypothetical protein [Planctomycetota bacterium]